MGVRVDDGIGISAATSATQKSLYGGRWYDALFVLREPAVRMS